MEKLPVVDVRRVLAHERARLRRHPRLEHQLPLLLVERGRDVGEVAGGEVRALEQVVEAVLAAEGGLLPLVVEVDHARRLRGGERRS